MKLSAFHQYTSAALKICLMCLLTGCGVRTIKSLSESMLLSKLPNEIPGEFESEPGCVFTTADLVGDGYILGRNEGRSPWIGLKTGAQRLYVRSENFPSNLGEQGLLEYYADNLEVSVLLEAPQSCQNKEEDCLYRDLRGTLTLRLGKRTEKVLIVASCGC